MGVAAKTLEGNHLVRQHWAALSLLMYSGQFDVTECFVVHMKI